MTEQAFRPDEPPWGTCDWGDCDAESAEWRWAADLGQWLPVCESHATEQALRPKTKMDNPPACGAPKNWPWGYLPCGCRNDGYGGHLR